MSTTKPQKKVSEFTNADGGVGNEVDLTVRNNRNGWTATLRASGYEGEEVAVLEICRGGGRLMQRVVLPFRSVDQPKPQVAVRRTERPPKRTW